MMINNEGVSPRFFAIEYSVKKSFYINFSLVRFFFNF